MMVSQRQSLETRSNGHQSVSTMLEAEELIRCLLKDWFPRGWGLGSTVNACVGKLRFPEPAQVPGQCGGSPVIPRTHTGAGSVWGLTCDPSLEQANW